MSPEVIKECCVQNRGYESPELNEVLILHYKGFRKIQGLEAYTQVRSLFLECNGLRRIENLECLQVLNSLYLQSNCIQRIENLDALKELRYLNLSNNSISQVEGLAALPVLETINLASNKICEVAALEGLRERPTLKSVNVSCNYIEDGDGLLDFWSAALPDVECLYVHHNPCTRYLKDSRKRLVSRLLKLRWLDERPVTEFERAGCEAWATGGKEAEIQAKGSFVLKEREAKEKSFGNFRRLQQAAAERFRQQVEAHAARERAREEAAAQMQESGSLAEGWVQAPAAPEKGDKSEELTRQAELEAKVAELLSSCRAEAELEGARPPQLLSELD